MGKVLHWRIPATGSTVISGVKSTSNTVSKWAKASLLSECAPRHRQHTHSSGGTKTKRSRDSPADIHLAGKPLPQSDDLRIMHRRCTFMSRKWLAVLSVILIALILAIPNISMASRNVGEQVSSNVYDDVVDDCPAYDQSGNPLLDEDGNQITVKCVVPEPINTPPPADNGQLDTSCVGDPLTVAEPHHMVRLQILDPVFRSGGMLAWMDAAGFTRDADPDARQPLEESYDLDDDGLPDVDYVSGFQIIASSVVVNWPNAVTTDTPSRITWKEGFSEKLLVAENTGSTIYTNVVANGPVTIYADATNWGQLASILGCDNTTVVDVASTDPKPAADEEPQNPSAVDNDGTWCLSEKELGRRYGIAREDIQDARNGILYDPPAHKVPAGALLRLNKGNPFELNQHGWYVAGQKSAGYLPAWNPPSCRPMELN